MHYYSPHIMSAMQYTNISVLDFKRGDVNGDRIIDNVYLVGERTNEESPFTKNIILIIQDGRSGAITRIPLKENAGYNPTISLYDFTGDYIKDIIISIDSGGSGGYAFYYIYTFVNNSPREIFNFEKFNQQYQYTVTYKDNYKVEVSNVTQKKNFIIDLSERGKDYLSEIYNTNGTLIKPINGWVNPLGSLFPIDFQRDGIYELYAEQSIAGRYNADSLGYIQTSLEWNNRAFVPFFQTVGILPFD